MNGLQQNFVCRTCNQPLKLTKDNPPWKHVSVNLQAPHRAHPIVWICVTTPCMRLFYDESDAEHHASSNSHEVRKAA